MQASVHIGESTGGDGRLNIVVEDYPKPTAPTTQFATLRLKTSQGEFLLFMQDLNAIRNLAADIEDMVDEAIRVATERAAKPDAPDE